LISYLPPPRRRTNPQAVPIAAVKAPQSDDSRPLR
jgi:hypothetical protein